MKKVWGILAALGVLLGTVICAQAAELEVKQAVITQTDGTTETLDGAEQAATRLNIWQVAVPAKERPGLEAVTTMNLVFPKDASEVYLVLKLDGIVPGEKLAVYQDETKVPSAVTAPDELTLRLTSSGGVEVYRQIPEPEQEEQTIEKEAAPATGESSLPLAMELLMSVFFVLFILSGIMLKKTNK